MSLRVLVTRAPHQSSALAEELRQGGADPVLIPTIEVVEPSSWKPLEDALLHLDSFDWMLFTSANAVQRFAARAESHQSQFRGRVAAIGSATAKVVKACGYQVDLIPPQAVAESMAEALQPWAKPGVRFLLLRAEQARDHLPEVLRAAGAEVVIVPVYRTVIPAASVDAVAQLFQESPPDAVTFTSSSSVTNLLALLEQAQLVLPAEVKLVSIGPITSKTMRDAGLEPFAEAEEATVKSLAEACLKLG